LKTHPDIPGVLDEQRRWPFIKLVLNGLLQAAAAVVMAVLIKNLFDAFVTSSQQTNLSFLELALALSASVLATAYLRMKERVLAEALGQAYAHSIRMTIFDRLAILSPRALGKQSRGAMLLRFIGDLTALRQWISMGLARLVVAGTTTIATLIALAIIAPTLALIVGVVLGLGGLLALLSGKPLEVAVRESRKRRVHIANNISEKLGAMNVVRAFGRQNTERKRLERQSAQLKSAMMQRARLIGLLRGLVQMITGLATVGALIVGAYEVSLGKATPGMVVAAMTLVGILTPPLRDLGRVYELWQAATVSFEKLTTVMNAGPRVEESPKAKRLKKGKGVIAFEHVRIKGIIKSFSATAQAGERIALIGPNGSGKSSLLMLAARLDDPDKGTILLDGQNVKKLKSRDLAKAVGVVSPDLPLMRGTVAQNIRYRMDKASTKDVKDALHLAGADEFVSTQSRGIETTVKEGAKNFSLGERQRLQLARAIIGTPRLLLLDEADTNLDPQGAEALKTLLDSFEGTIIMVTHNPEWINEADTIWRMEDGRLAEITTPEQFQSTDTGRVTPFSRAPYGGAA